MDKAALESIKQLIIRKSRKQGTDEETALQQADNVIAVISQPDGTTSYQLVSGLVVALMFDGAEQDQQMKELILSIAPQVMLHLNPDKQSKLASLLNEMKS